LPDDSPWLVIAGGLLVGTVEEVVTVDVTVAVLRTVVVVVVVTVAVVDVLAPSCIVALSSSR
jgi:hypothetical protein